MKFSVNWLKEFVDIPISVSELADLLSLSGLEVEEVAPIGQTLSNVVTGKIESITPHPDADRLVITQVTDGNTTHQIVTGAKNIFEGAIVPVSLPGATLASGLKIKASKLRGVESNGMLCSEAELGVQDSAEGIWILPEDTPIGVDFIEYAQLKDFILEVSILPNRGDCQSIWGLAREIAVLLRLPLKTPATDISLSSKKCTTQIQNNSPDVCQLYSGRLINQLKSNKTPFWMQRRLQTAGFRSINLTVDITNYVLLELGQPMHAFDLEKVSGNSISIQKVTQETPFITLDNIERILPAKTLVISDKKGPIAIAGVMGGYHTEIGQNSKEIFLEVANFSASSIRKTGTSLGLRTESAIRFEKGIDIELVEVASNRAAHLFQTLGRAEISAIRITDNEKQIPSKVPFSTSQINTFLGSNFSEEEMVEILERLGFQRDGNTMIVPGWRANDISEWPCLAEEIARVKGYQDIPSHLPRGPQNREPHHPAFEIAQNLKPFFTANGFKETITFPMVSPEDAEKCTYSKTAIIQIQNPLSPAESVMRQSLLTSLLKVTSFNLKRQLDQFKCFEIGKTYLKTDEGIQETFQLGALVTGGILLHPKTIEETQIATHRFEWLKGISENLFSQYKKPLTFVPSEQENHHPSFCLDIKMDDLLIAQISLVHPQLLNAYDINQDVAYLEINITALLMVEASKKIFKRFSKFPSTRRDIAFLAPLSLSYNEIESIIQSHLPKICSDYFLFDSFESEKLGADKKSLAFGFIYQDPQKTLEDEEVNTSHEKLIDALKAKLPISIRQ